MSEFLGRFSIDHLFQSGGGDISYRTVKETGANQTVDFDNGAHPWGIAGWSLGRKLAEMLTKAAGDLSEFSRWLYDEPMVDAGFILENQMFDFFFECMYLCEVQAYFALLFAGPYERPVERFGGKVGGEKGDRVETERSCGVDCLAQIAVVCFLYGSATGDRHGRVVMTDSEDAFVDEIAGSAHAADGIVNLRGAVQGDNDVVEQVGDFFCAFVKQEAGGKQCEVNLPVTKEVAESGEVIVEQRFAACENDMPNTKCFERVVVTLQVLRANLVAAVTLPDVAHDATTIASSVGVEDEDRQTGERR